MQRMNPFGLILPSLTRMENGCSHAKWTPRKRLLTRINSWPAVATSSLSALARCSQRLITLAWAGRAKNFSAKRGEWG